MSRRTPRCRGCRERLDGPVEVVEVSGSAGGVVVSGGMHVITCPRGHRSWPDPDYGASFISPLHLAVEEVVGRAPPRSGIRRRPVCPDCGGGLGERLPGQPREVRVTFEIDSDVGGSFSPLTWTVELPSASCASCGEQFTWLDRELGSHLSDAVIDAIGRGAIEAR